MKSIIEYTNRFRILKGGKIGLVVSALLGSTTLILAAPAGGVVTSGNATITNIAKTTNITQNTQKASINWQKFNIANDEIVNFNQPNINSIILNRVVGNEKSIINGALNANGQVWLLNSNGVLFGKGAKINTAGLLATTKELSDTDFQAGNYHFKGTSTASVINLAEIDISNSGYATLLANRVTNEGTIRAVRGSVRLVGAEEVTINLNKNSIVELIVNRGVLDALVQNKGAILADGGEIFLTTNAVNELLKSVVNNTGIIEANSMDGITGDIELFAHGGVANIAGNINAADGFVETSGDKVSVADSFRVVADKWLIDPTDFTIAASGGDSSGATISANLATTDIEIQSVSGTTGTRGDIHVNDTISWDSEKQLTLNAQNDIFINAEITATNESAKLSLLYGQQALSAGNIADYYINEKINLQAGDNFLTKLGSDGATTTWSVINTKEALQAMTVRDSAKSYALGVDLSLTGTNNWIPIGVNYRAFKGKFDGLGHSISNLNVNDSTRTEAGFFGVIEGAIIKNIALVDVSISGKNKVGGLVGWDQGSIIQNSYATGVVNGVTEVGGLVGRTSNNSIIENSYAAVKTTATLRKVGGLVGYNESSTIKNSYATGSASGRDEVGGLVGANFANSTIKNSYATANVTATDLSKGGLVGRDIDSTSTIENSFWNKETSGLATSAGGTGLSNEEMSFGWIYRDATWDIVGDSTVTSSTPILKFDTVNNKYTWAIAPLALSYTLSEKSSIYNGETQSISDLYTISSIFENSYSFVDGDYKFKIDESEVDGFRNAGVYENIKVISNNEFLAISDTGNSDGKFSIAQKDITSITGITALNKTYDGATSATLITSNADFTEMISGDALNVATSTGTFSDKNVGIGKTVSITDLTLGGDDALNYNLVSDIATTTANITKKDITAIVGITAENKVYDGTTIATLVTSSADFVEMINGDILSVATATGIFADKDVGVAKGVNISDLTLGGDDALNYNLVSTTATTTATISKVPTPPDPIDPTPPDPIDPTPPDPVDPTPPDPVDPTPPDPVDPTPDPEPISDVVEEDIEKVVGTILNPNTTQIKVPNLKAAAMASALKGRGENVNVTFGKNVSLVSKPTEGQSTKHISLSEAKEMQAKTLGMDNVDEVKVPLSHNSKIMLVDGGVNLPDGVEQEFYIENDNK